jgi:putative DNA primase/helicase
MMTKISNCEYDNVSGKQPERWIKFLDDVTDGDKELQRYIQKAVGYSLTGSIREQCLFMCYGLGQNGKSTFLETVTDILGGYARNAQTETIMLNVKGASGGASASPDIARLKGARMVTANEPNQGVRMNEGLVKQLTGGDKITARFLHSREFEFVPEFKLWMSANNKPIITGTDQGIWRRMRLIPFIVAIPENKRDKSLKVKLNKELPQILKWAVDGCIMWLQEGLEVPACVQKATAEYRQEMDSLGQFCDLAIESDNASSTKFADVYEVYVNWAEENHEYLLSANKFGKDFVKRYPERYRLGDGIYYKRIKLSQYGLNLVKKTQYTNGYQQKFSNGGA